MDQPTTDLDRVRQAALYFTMTMAVLGLVFWALTFVSDSGVVSTLGGVFSAATAVGGTVMGLLYLLARSRQRDTGEVDG
jgi:membrane associated rhomboid family serine protease